MDAALLCMVITTKVVQAGLRIVCHCSLIEQSFQHSAPEKISAHPI
jgi:hypothetical protein